MNNNTKAKFKQLTKNERKALADAGRCRLSRKAKVGAASRHGHGRDDWKPTTESVTTK
jgi:hypothetical protein